MYDRGEINALVLAGGINRFTVLASEMPGYKALLPVHGRRMVDFTIQALTRSPAVKRLCVVGPVEEIRRSLPPADTSIYARVEFVKGAETLIDNLCIGLEHFQGSSLVLVVPSDLPLITPDAIRAFLDSCSSLDSAYEQAIFWSMVPEQNFTAQYRKVRKGFNRFKDVSLCHGNLLLMTPSLANNRRFISRINRIYHARKSSVRAAAAVGPGIGLTYLFGVHLLRLLTLSRFARIISADFHIGLIPVLMHDPRIAVDIDELRDYRFVLEELE